MHSDIFKQVRRITVSGSGDPFASRVFKDLFEKIDKRIFPDLRISLRTNGIMLTPAKWDQIKNIHYAIDALSISIDAATAKTYRSLRRGGNFKILLENLKFFKEIKREKKLKIGLNFVVQQQNFKEMTKFVELAKKYDCEEVAFSQLRNRGTYSPEEYVRIAIHEPKHQQHQQLIKITNKTIFKDPIVFMGNLSNLIRGK